METLSAIFELFHHLPEHISHWSDVMGPWVYVLLFCIIFAETGLVFAPILPGDSLLFAAGALSVAGGALKLWVLLPVLLLAAITGDFTNYSIGRKLGPLLFRNPDSKLFNRKYLERTKVFYARHGGKAVVLARFLPILRTYAPFVAGMSRMPRVRYLPFNILGAALWINLFLLGGHWFGNLPFVKTRFQYVILAIVAVSVMPAIIEVLRTRRQRLQSDIII